MLIDMNFDAERNSYHYSNGFKSFIKSGVILNYVMIIRQQNFNKIAVSDPVPKKTKIRENRNFYFLMKSDSNYNITKNGSVQFNA